MQPDEDWRHRTHDSKLMETNQAKNTCQWYSGSSWPDPSAFALFGNISVFLWMGSLRSVQLVPRHELPLQLGLICTGSVPRVMDSAGQFAPANMMSHPRHPYQTHTEPVRVDWPLPPHKCRNQQKPSCFLSEIQPSWRKGNTQGQFLNSSHRR